MALLFIDRENPKKKLCLEYSSALLIIIFATFISLYNLGYFPIRVFDESRQAVNALEMFKSGIYSYTTFEYKVDLWNTKPPLLIWLQVLCFHIFGVSEFSLRIPSALAGVGVAFILLHFSKKHLGNIWIGFLAILILFTSQAYVDIHALRTADYDSFLTLWVVLLVTSVYASVYTKKYSYLIVSNLSIVLIVFTKGIAGLMFLPGIFIFLIIDKSLLPILKSRVFWISLIMAILFILTYYISREYITPGYLNAVWENELGGRYNRTLEGNSGSKRFYIDLIYGHKFGRLLLILAGLSFPFSFITKKYRRISLYFLSISISFILILSAASTKLPWYIVPVIPFLSFLSAISIIQIYIIFCKINSKIGFILIAFMLFFLLFNKIKATIQSTLVPKEDQKEVSAMGYLFQINIKNNVAIDTSYTYLNFEHYYPHHRFYNLKLDIPSLKVNNINDFNINNLPTNVACYDSVIIDNIEQKYITKLVKRDANFNFYHIIMPKSSLIDIIKSYQKAIYVGKEFKILINNNNINQLLIVNFKKSKMQEKSLIFTTLKNNINQTEVVKIPSNDEIKIGENYYRFIELQGNFKQILKEG